VTDDNVPFDYSEFKAAVCAEARADWFGVYEVWWHTNTRYPSLPVSRRLAIAERLISDLRGECEIEFYDRRWTGGDGTPINYLPDAPIAPERVDDILREWATWVPQDQRVVGFLVKGRPVGGLPEEPPASG
jgi:hypothetical protein